MRARLTAVQLGVGLTRSRSLVHAGRNRLMANACCRVSMWYTARASLWASTVSALPLPCLRVSLAKYFCPGAFWRRKSTAASEKAHLRCALPIFLPEVHRRLPADSLAHFTSRQ